MNAEAIKKEKLIRFIKSNNPFYLFTSFDKYSVERLKEIKKDIEQVIRATAEKNKQRKERKDNN